MPPERWQQVDQLYHAALEDRAVLDTADPELRREVESLLAHDGNALDRPAWEGAAELLDDTRTLLVPGTQLGPYRIEAALGAGGMGEVHLALDTRLGRKVAIKVSAKQFTERFEREARAIAALNHPHICHLYDVGPNYLVMELVEGENLAVRLKKGALSSELGLRYGAEIADALAAAHAKGIIHRDLKPGNMMVTKAGIKVLDFGLAKTAGDQKMTVSQAIMGTPAYMAPEQREGKDCDARTDIYALGLVLREMVTDPPSHVAHVIDRCLATDPENRWQTARDLKAELEWVPPAPPQAKARFTWPWIAVAAVGVLVAAVGWWYATLPAAPRPVARWTTTLPAADFLGSGVSISRDGTRLAYHGKSGDSQRIWVRMLDEPEGKPIPGTDGGFRPFFSPDGKWLAYFQGVMGPLKKVPVTGGPPVTLCEEAFFTRGTWGEDDRIIFPGSGGGLMRVSASGGGCENLTTPDRQKNEIHTWPQILPGGRSMLFTIVPVESGDSSRIAVFDMKTRQYRVVVNGGASGRYVPSGHLVYVRGGTMFAVPFDLKRLAVTGSEKPVIEGVFYLPGGGVADYAFSDSGLLVYRTTQTRNLKILEWLDRKGTPQPSPAPPQYYESVRLSPDGQRVAVDADDVWVIELARGALTRLTTGLNYGWPIWTPDGRHMVFGYGAEGGGGLFWAPSDGSSKPEPLLGQMGIPDSWTPDGKTLLYEARQGPAHIWSLQPAVSGGDGKPRLLFEANSFNESDAQISPDGHWVAYISDESGKNRVYVRPLPGPGGKTPISIEAGQEPRWRRDGRELFYRDPEKSNLMAVDVQTGPEFRVGQPHVLFALGGVPWDAAPDGQRFLVAREPAAAASEAKMQVVVNWFEELKQKAPRK